MGVSTKRGDGPMPAGEYELVHRSCTFGECFFGKPMYEHKASKTLLMFSNMGEDISDLKWAWGFYVLGKGESHYNTIVPNFKDVLADDPTGLNGPRPGDIQEVGEWWLVPKHYEG